MPRAIGGEAVPHARRVGRVEPIGLLRPFQPQTAPNLAKLLQALAIGDPQIPVIGAHAGQRTAQLGRGARVDVFHDFGIDRR
ncbi:MAG TPA: hypothetical protein VGV14_04375, partial [Rhodanobacter sp.]|nr:hypothetical protein [Rhodanobacter sp.]